MTEGYLLELDFIKQLKKVVTWFKQQGGQPKLTVQPERNMVGGRPPIRYITKVPYSTCIIKKRSVNSYDLDGDERVGQEYLVMVDGDNPIPVFLTHYEFNGNQKQMIEFVGDNINGEIKLILGGNETDFISLVAKDVTSENITAALEKLPSIGESNMRVSIFPGRWLIEFVGDLAGTTLDLFEVDLHEDAEFQVHVSETMWADSREEAEVHYPIKLIGEYDGDDNAINDAVAAGSIGTAEWFPGIGYVSNLNECREYNGDGTPNL
ncbi:hypothetical protein [Gimesia fumaroli]|uniref:Uncharacterized protein n=1 Tax=Gimesia fumaroli TaxID=2527976 RepID=A0A518IKS4_9PLAN|nr:hypothetical protein [Gimesia fumaroli]QDV53693.1 hypothetical protein Enr17x_57740 [Gimesia fumaroli]